MTAAPLQVQEGVMLTRLVYARLNDLVTALDAGQRFEFMNRGYATSESRQSTRDMQERLLWEIIADTPLDGLHILDAGCGRGGALAAIADRHKPAALTGIDLSAEQIEACRNRFGRLKIRWQVADAASLPQQTASQDVILAIELFQELQSPSSFARSAAQTLRTGACLLIADLLDDSTWATLVSQLENCGFKLDSSRDLSTGVLAAATCRQKQYQKNPADADAGNSEENFLRTVLGEELAAQQTALANADLRYQAMRFIRDSRPVNQHAPDWHLPQPAVTCRAVQQTVLIMPEPVEQVFPYGAPTGDTRLPVFAFPFAGGGASVFRGWHQTLSDEMQFCPVQLPGREGFLMDAPLQTMEQWVAWAMAQIQPQLQAIGSERPFALFGHCLGGLLAYELALALAEAGRPPAALWLTATNPPHLPLSSMLINLLQIAPFDNADLAVVLRVLGGTPPGVLAAPAMMRAVQKTMQADFAVGARYQRFDRRRLPCPVHTLAGTRDKLVTPAHMSGWQAYSATPIAPKTVDAEHFFLREARLEVQAMLRTQAATIKEGVA
ncbi:methyltransferase domain-containing protein [Undibacterium sp. CY18W]|uniref:Methyltransferase domain-containing protein n=1 Tax=Undibacterium hunanense TaxID=2762292 RepID=A0ABR6ZMN2_9BURK|nr:thioesterase domain-containing protein [Undibacterium hunanense]MBC3917140.1 methyltransferase domain-containing protein [Undibacterium hunanense]